MDNQLLTIIISAIFSAGATWGVLNNRVKALEKQMEKHDEHGERLTRLETKLDIIVAHLMDKE
jgi:hypothetical protein